MRNVARILAASTVAVVALGTSLVPAQAQSTVDGVVMARGGLTVRSAPTTHGASEGHLTDGATVPVSCRVDGGIVGGNTTWYALPPTTHEWVSGRYLGVKGKVPECGNPPAFNAGAATTGVIIRRGPTTADQNIGSVARGQELQLQCKVKSQRISNNPYWYKLNRSQGWVSAQFVSVTKPTTWCTS